MFNISNQERLAVWRKFRQSLEPLSYEDKMKSVSDFWSKAPRVNFYLNPEHVKEWPDPWELITDNMYCDIAVALGMTYTLALTDGIDPSRLKLQIMRSRQQSLEVNLSVVDQGLYVLNYSQNEVLNISQLPRDLYSLYQFDYIDLNLKNL
jgi:hypothetical protein